jgi:hypothetical protein
MSRAIDKAIMIESYKTYQTNMGTFNHLDSLLRTRAECARRLCGDIDVDENIIRHIDYINDLIRKLIVI